MVDLAKLKFPLEVYLNPFFNKNKLSLKVNNDINMFIHSNGFDIHVYNGIIFSFDSSFVNFRLWNSSYNEWEILPFESPFDEHNVIRHHFYKYVGYHLPKEKTNLTLLVQNILEVLFSKHILNHKLSFVKNSLPQPLHEEICNHLDWACL